MKKQLKAALAVAAAGTVLLGGGGSWANWTDSTTLASSNIQSGTLDIGTCVPATANPTGWKYRITSTAPYQNVTNLITFRAQPGWDVYYQCFSPVKVVGGRLKAQLTTNLASVAGGLNVPANSVRVYLSDQANNTIYDSSQPNPVLGYVTEAANAGTINAVVVFNIANTEANNASQGATLGIVNLPMTVTQIAIS